MLSPNPFLELQYLQTKTEKLAYRYISTSESFPTLLFIHGNMLSSFVWFTVIDDLKSKYNILCPDLRGFGHSSYNKPINSLDDYCIDLYELLTFLKIQKVIVLGLSLGGGVSFKLAIKYPEIVKGLVLIGTVGLKGYYWKTVDYKGNVLEKKMPDREFLEKFPQTASYSMCLQTKNFEFLQILLEKFLCNTGRTISNENFKIMIDEALLQKNYLDSLWAINIFNISEDFNGVTIGTNEIANISCPTLIIHGSKDIMIPLKESIAIFHTLKSKKKYIEVIENKGHVPNLDDPELLVKILMMFFNEIEL